MELLRDFNKISKNDVSIAGGKGASLGEMTKAGISVPPGFVILSTAFEKFLEETDLNVEIEAILDSVNHKEIHTTEHASETIEALILGAVIPKDIIEEIQKFFKNLNSKYVAVRSSATAEDSASAAWAGQLESYLNTTEENLLENVKKCWASLFTPRAIFYRFEKNLHKQKISVAVVVQKMVESEKSGIAFSVHPVTQDRNQLIIEAGFGLGEAIVSGQITPDSYVVEKQPRRILDKNIQIQTRGLYCVERGGNEWLDIPKGKGEKPVLSDEEILALSEIILRIESHYGFPCDIEWAAEKKKFYIVQSRPITTLSVDAKAITESWAKRWERGLKIQKAIDYSYSIGKPFQKMFGLGMFNWLYVLEESGASAIYDKKTERDIFDSYYLNQFENKDFFKVFDDYEKHYQPHLTFLNDLSKQDLSKLKISKLLEVFHEYKKSLINYFVPMWAIVIWEQVIELALYKTLRKYFVADEIEKKALIVLSLTSGNYLTREEYDLYLISKLPHQKQREGLQTHMNKYSYIPMYDYDYSPYDILYFEKRLRDIEPKKVLEKQKQIAENEKRLEIFTTSENIDDLDKVKIKAINFLFNHKDQRSHYRSIESFLGRKIYLEIANRLNFSISETLLLTDEEITALLEGKVKKVDVQSRAKKHALVYMNGNIEIYTNSKMDDYLRQNIKTDSKNEIRGLSVSSGIASGPVQIIKTIKELSLIEDGDILVTSMTRPDYVAAMKKCAAIVTDEGGMLCHAAIVSRELNIPCIVGTKNATSILKNGDKVEVDANIGSVRILR